MKIRQFILSLAAGLHVLSACGEADQAGTTPQISREETVERAPPKETGDFGVSVEVPTSWHRMSNAESDGILETGRDMIAGDDENMERVLNSQRDKGRVLFSIFEHPPGSPIDFNASVIASAENVSLAPGIRRGSDYLFHMRRMLANSGMLIEMSEDIEETRVDGQVFDSIRSTMQISGLTVHQQVQAMRHDDHVIAIVRSWMTDEQAAATQAVVDSIKLDW